MHLTALGFVSNIRENDKVDIVIKLTILDQGGKSRKEKCLQNCHLYGPRREKTCLITWRPIWERYNAMQ